MTFYTNFSLVGENALISGYDDDKKRFTRREKVKPYLFTSSRDKEAQYHTIFDRPVDRIDFDTVKDARAFLKRYEGVAGMEVFGLNKFDYLHIFDNYRKKIDYDPELIRVVNFDIEVAADDGFPDITTAEKEVTAITLEMKGVYIVLGCGDFVTDDDAIKYYKCTDEAHLLKAFLNIINSPTWAPDALTGWHIEGFDIPYIVNRIKRILGEEEAKKLSPWRILQEETIMYHNQETTIYKPRGIQILDYMALYKKFTYSVQESYALDYIAKVELDKQKLDYSEYGSLLELYKKNYQKFIEYNIHDVRLVSELNSKLKFLELVFAIAYDAKINYEDCLGTTNMWDIICHNYLLERRKVIPQFKVKPMTHKIAGGYVKQPTMGTYRWVVSFDLTSLYPHLIMQYNISPETFVHIFDPVVDIDMSVARIMANEIDRERLGDHTLAANMTTYRRDKLGFLPALMQRVFMDRKMYKDEMLVVEAEYESKKGTLTKEEEKVYTDKIAALDAMQMAKKIQMNALYGALANQYFRWFEESMAEAITASGQLAAKWIHNAVNLKLNTMLKTEGVDYVIAVDTDSIYLNLEAIVEKIYEGKVKPETKKIIEMLDKFCDEKMKPFIASEFQKLADHVNAYENKLHMKREVIADIGLWTVKKRYILNVWMDEHGFLKEPKVKVKGLESRRSSTPEYFRNLLKKCYEIVMRGKESEVQQLIAGKREDFFTQPFEKVAKPTGVNDLEKYSDPHTVYKKGSPAQVKAALMYNKFIKDNNLQDKYTYIYSGDKIRWSYLKEPNPLHTSMIAAPDTLPKEFDLDEYINYPMQWEKGFENAIGTVLDARGWSMEETINLEDFYV